MAHETFHAGDPNLTLGVATAGQGRLAYGYGLSNKEFMLDLVDLVSYIMPDDYDELSDEEKKPVVGMLCSTSYMRDEIEHMLQKE